LNGKPIYHLSIYHLSFLPPPPQDTKLMTIDKMVAIGVCNRKFGSSSVGLEDVLTELWAR